MTYTAAQIGEALGNSERAIQKRASREEWPFTKRPGRGGGKLYAVSLLPKDVQDAVLTHEITTSVAAVPANTAPSLPASALNAPALPSRSVPANQPTATSQLNHAQRQTMCARLAFVREIDRLAQTGITKKAVMENLVVLARQDSLPPHIAPLLVLANDRPGRKRVLSMRSLQRWFSDYERGGELALAPARPGKDLSIPHWAPKFLAVYQQPSKPTVADAYRQVFGLPHAPKDGAPSIWAVRRFVNKLSVPALAQGRVTGNAMLKILPHRKRDTSSLWPGDVFTMDGTTFDSEILHPHNGQPFKPEITLVIDVATRRCVGTSAALSESAIATLDAIRMACLFAGIPAMLHADNGPGYINSIWTAEGTGLMSRLGVELVNSIPGRPQGKGLMERAIGTICVRAAKRLPSCTHADMDKDAAKKVFKLSRAALKKGKNILPTWEEFKAVLLRVIEEYNNTPHTGAGMPEIQDERTGRMRPMTPNEAWAAGVAKGFEPVTVPDDMKDELFMPSERRKVRNGRVKFLGGEYYHAALAELHGEIVDVRYEVWDSAQVYIWSVDGVQICTAQRDGHSDPYQPKSALELADDKRRRAALGRLEAKAGRIAPGAVIQLPEADSRAYSDDLILGKGDLGRDVIDVTPEPAPSAPTRPLFLNPDHHYRWLMTNRDQCTADDEAWLARFAQGAEYADMADRYEFEGIGYTPAAMQAQADQAAQA